MKYLFQPNIFGFRFTPKTASYYLKLVLLMLKMVILTPQRKGKKRTKENSNCNCGFSSLISLHF